MWHSVLCVKQDPPIQSVKHTLIAHPLSSAERLFRSRKVSATLGRFHRVPKYCRGTSWEGGVGTPNFQLRPRQSVAAWQAGGYSPRRLPLTAPKSVDCAPVCNSARDRRELELPQWRRTSLDLGSLRTDTFMRWEARGQVGEMLELNNALSLSYTVSGR